MLSGTAQLLEEQTTAFSGLIEQVATPGGITEAGVEPLRRGLPPVFDRMFEEMLRRNESVQLMTEAQFEGRE
jgi:pyrroline-5-carboxylate reductase